MFFYSVDKSSLFKMNVIRMYYIRHVVIVMWLIEEVSCVALCVIHKLSHGIIRTLFSHFFMNAVNSDILLIMFSLCTICKEYYMGNVQLQMHKLKEACTVQWSSPMVFDSRRNYYTSPPKLESNWLQVVYYFTNYNFNYNLQLTRVSL